MPGLPGNHDIEGSPGGVPLFELRDLDLETALAGVLGHPLVGIDAEHVAPLLLEGSRGEAGADPDVEDVGPRARDEDRVDHGVRIGRARSLIAFGFAPERLGDLTGAVRFARRELLWLWR